MVELAQPTCDLVPTHANNYVAANDIGRFTTALCEHLTDGRITDKWKDAVRHYTELKVYQNELNGYWVSAIEH